MGNERLMNSRLYVGIGKRMSAERGARNVSVPVMARHLCVSVSQLKKYEQGKNRVPVSALIQFADFLQMPITDFLPEDAAKYMLKAPSIDKIAGLVKAAQSALDDALMQLPQADAKERFYG